MKTKNFLKMAFLLLALVGGVNSVWANQTTLISGVTLPDIPESTLDLSSQTDYTANAYGWIVETSPKANIGSKTWHSKLATDGSGANWTVPEGCTAPFVSSTEKAFSRYTVRKTERTHAIRFTGAEKASFLVSRSSDEQKTVVAVFSYVDQTQTLIDSKSMSSGSIGELLFEGLTAATTYIAYIYGSASSNSDWYEFALKAPVTTYTVTYKAGAGTGDDVVDDNAAAVADCPNTFTAPSGKDFCGWNTESNGSGTPYTVGAIVTSNLTLYAQWSASHSVTYSLGSGTGTLPTQADVAEGATFSVAAVPGDLVPPSGKEFKCWNDGTSDYEPGATYTMSTSDVTLTAFYQDRTYKGLTPTSTMDFDNPGNMFVSVWTTANKLTQNFYFDASNGIAVFSAYALYLAKNNDKISWMVSDAPNSAADTWSATGNFKGNSYYFSSDSKAATVRATERMHYYRVKGITSASALMGGRAKMEAYLVTAGVVSADPVSENSIDAAGTLSITGLNTSNEYIIKVYGDNGSSNVKFREIAFNFPKVTSVSGTITASGWNTFSCSYPLDLNNISGGTAYYAKEVSGGNVVLSPTTATVRAGEGLMIQGTADTEFTINVAASGSAISGNMMVGMPAGGEVAVAGSGYNYVFGWTDAAYPGFYKVTSDLPTLTAGKAYLHTTDALTEPEARLGIIFEESETGISNVKREAISNNRFYNLNGQEIAQPTKGLYIVNGKKIVIK